MHDVMCDVISYCARSCDMFQVSACDKILIENLKKRTYGSE